MCRKLNLQSSSLGTRCPISETNMVCPISKPSTRRDLELGSYSHDEANRLHPCAVLASAVSALFSMLMIASLSVAASYPAYRLIALISDRLEIYTGLADLHIGYALFALGMTLWPGLLPFVFVMTQVTHLGATEIFDGVLEAGTKKHFLPFVLLLPLAYTAHLYTHLLLTIALKWILIGRESKSGNRYRVWSLRHLRSLVFRAVLHSCYQRYVLSLLGTPVLRMFYRALGAHIGRRVTLANTPVFDHPDLVWIGDDVHIGDLSMLSTAAAMSDFTIQSGVIHLGDRSLVGMRALMQPDTSVPDDCIVGALST